MKNWTVAAALLFASTFGVAQTAQSAPAARKSCEDLKVEITKKLEAKNVASYSLDVIDKGEEGDGKVVGSCDGGTKSLVYSRTASSHTDPSDAKKPQ